MYPTDDFPINHLHHRCETLAPLVVNGQTHPVFCDQPEGHEGPHSVTVKWAQR